MASFETHPVRKYSPDIERQDTPIHNKDQTLEVGKCEKERDS